MLSSRNHLIAKSSLSRAAATPCLSVLSSASGVPLGGNCHKQQKRTFLGIVHAIDKRVYRWAKGVLPPISKTENIALGCGTIGEF